MKDKYEIQKSILLSAIGEKFFCHIINLDHNCYQTVFYRKEEKNYDNKKRCFKNAPDSIYDYSMFNSTNISALNNNKTRLSVSYTKNKLQLTYVFYEEENKYTTYMYDNISISPEIVNIYVIEPTRNSPPIFLLTNSVIDDIFDALINGSKKIIKDSRIEQKLKIENIEVKINTAENVSVGQPYKSIDKKYDNLVSEMASIKYDDNGDVLSYSYNGISYKREKINSDNEIDYEEKTYLSDDERKILFQRHVYGNKYDIIFDEFNSSIKHWKSNDGEPLDASKDITLEICDGNGTSIVKIVNDQPLDPEKIEENKYYSSYEIKASDKESALYSNGVMIKTIIADNQFKVLYCVDDQEYFTVDCSSIGSFYVKAGTLEYRINRDGEYKNSFGTSMSFNPINGKMDIYDSIYSHIEFTIDGQIESYYSDYIDVANDCYYVRDRFNVPYKYYPNIIGIDLSK